MSPEATTESSPTTVTSRRVALKKLSAESLRALCAIKSDERLAAHQEADRTTKAWLEKARQLDEEHAVLMASLQEAEAERDAHADSIKPGGPVERGELTRQEYDDEHRALVDAAKAAKTAVEKNRDNIQAILAPFRKRLEDANKRVQEIDRQYGFHERRAREAGVDLSDFWTPDQGLPAEDATQDEEAA